MLKNAPKMEEMAYFGVFATILLLIKNLFIYDFIYDFIDQLKKSLCISSLYLWKKNCSQFSFFVRKLTKCTPLFFTLIPPLKTHPAYFANKYGA